MNLFTRISLAMGILKGGTQTMVDLYVALIINGRRTIDQVPAQLREAVLAELTALGLDGYGNPIITP